MGRSAFRYGALGERVGAALVCVVLGVLAGCDSGSPGPDPGPSVSSSASASASVEGTGGGSPTVTPAPQVPALPAAAREASEAGARAFVGYYWELVNYAQATGDVKRLQSVAAPTCDVCAAFTSKVGALYAKGGRITGGTNRSQISEAVELQLRSGDYGLRVEQVVSHDSQTIVKPDGTKEERGAGADQFTAFVLWTAGHWRLDVMELR